MPGEDNVTKKRWAGGFTYSAEGVAKAGGSLIVEGICLAEDEGEIVFGEERGLVDLLGNGRDG